MLRGANNITMDEKGRIAIPTRYRELLQDECNGALVCTLDTSNQCLLLYPLSEWELIEQKLKKLSDMQSQERRLKRILLGNATEVDIDKNGRMLVPSVLRNRVGLTKQLMLVGQLNKFEIWDQQAWQDQMDEDIAAVKETDEPLTAKLMDFSL